MDFVFSDKTVLQAVHFKHFWADCQQLAGNEQELRRIEAQERSALTKFLTSEYQEIITNFDPQIIKLRKKRKIVVAESAAQDLF